MKLIGPPIFGSFASSTKHARARQASRARKFAVWVAPAEIPPTQGTSTPDSIIAATNAAVYVPRIPPPSKINAVPVAITPSV